MELEETDSITIRKKQNHLSLAKKMEIVNELENGITINILAEKYAVSRSAVVRIKVNKEELKKAVTTQFHDITERRKIRRTRYPQMEKAVYEWYLEQKTNKTTITGTMLRVKARYFYRKFYENGAGFNASPGWMEKFKKRFGIRFRDDDQDNRVNDVPMFTVNNNPEVLVVEPICYEHNNGDDHKDFSGFGNDYEAINGCNGEDNDSFDNGDGDDVKRQVSHAEAIDSVDILIMWAIQNNLDESYSAALRAIREKATELLENVKEIDYYQNKSMHNIDFCKVEI